MGKESSPMAYVFFSISTDYLLHIPQDELQHRGKGKRMLSRAAGYSYMVLCSAKWRGSQCLLQLVNLLSNWIKGGRCRTLVVVSSCCSQSTDLSSAAGGQCLLWACSLVSTRTQQNLSWFLLLVTFCLRQHEGAQPGEHKAFFSPLTASCSYNDSFYSPFWTTFTTIVPRNGSPVQLCTNNTWSLGCATNPIIFCTCF